MDSQLPKPRALVNILSFLLAAFFSSSAFAGETDIDIFGLTYHLHRDGAVREAHLKMDHAGVKVFNPGLGLGHDFREDIHTGGLSLIINGGVFETCAGHPFTFAGVGGRYRKFFYKKYFWEANVMGALTYGNDPEQKGYTVDPLPFANFGIGHDYGKYLLTYSLSYVPKGSGGKITSSTDMLFLSMGVSF